MALPIPELMHGHFSFLIRRLVHLDIYLNSKVVKVNQTFFLGGKIYYKIDLIP